MGLRQDVRFCSAADGTRIAVATIGNGPPLVRASHWLSHVEHDLESPVWRPWLRELSRRHTYIRYDQRGCGLSDGTVDDLSLDLLVGDLEAVVDHLGLKRFPLLGSSQGGAIAMAYAHRHPERVSQLVLVGAYARGARRRATSDLARLEAETLVNLVRVGWGRDNDSFRQLFTNQYLPEGSVEQHRWWNDLERLTSTPEAAARTLAMFHDIDVTAIAAALDVPTLVVHSRRDARVPFDEGRRLAALIPGAQFVPLESANHILVEGEPAWAGFLDVVNGALATSTTTPAPAGPGALTAAEAAVLELVARGLDNHAIALRLGKSEKTVRNQVSTIFDKLGVRTRAEAIVRAIDRRDA
jgi:pimeloyl-ACP methyl ester carboxylesterase/DNA-binding CsgD family transcriptional regulator